MPGVSWAAIAPVFSDMPYPEQPVNPVPEQHREKNNDKRDAHQPEKLSILLPPYVISSQCPEDGPKKSAGAAYYEELKSGEVPKPENVTEIIFRRSRDQEQ